jgi:hypothetical protein
MSTESHFMIVAGPNEMDMMVSLFGRDRGFPTVDFTLRTTGGKSVMHKIMIEGLEHDGIHHGDKWKFRGLVMSMSGDLISGTYSHKSRKGMATIVEEVVG